MEAFPDDWGGAARAGLRGLNGLGLCVGCSHFSGDLTVRLADEIKAAR